MMMMLLILVVVLSIILLISSEKKIPSSSPSSSSTSSSYKKDKSKQPPSRQQQRDLKRQEIGSKAAAFERSQTEFTTTSNAIKYIEKYRAFSGGGDKSKKSSSLCDNDNRCTITLDSNKRTTLILREITNVTSASTISTTDSLILRYPAVIPVPAHCAINTAASKAAALLHQAIDLPQFLISPGIVAMGEGLFFPVKIAEKLRKESKVDHGGNLVDSIGDNSNDWLEQYIVEHNEILDGEIEYITYIIGLLEDEGNSININVKMEELPEPGRSKQQEWKKKLVKLSASLGRVSSYVSDSRQKEALDRESIVMRYIAQDLLADIKIELEKYANDWQRRFPFVIAHVFAVHAELESKQILGEATNSGDVYMKMADFLETEARILLALAPPTLHSVGVKFAPALARYSLLHDMLLAKANNELPVFVLNGDLILPRASEYLIWDDGLAPIRYLYSGHASIDPFGSIPLNRVDAFVWYCDFINKDLENCEINDEKIEIQQLFSQLGASLYELSENDDNELNISDDSNKDVNPDYKSKSVIDLSILRAVSLPGYRNWIEEGLNKKFKWTGEKYIHIVDGEVTVEKDALMELFVALSGSDWTDFTNWGSDRPLDEWYGVDVDFKGHVAKINLANNNLQGSLPEALEKLAFLTHIDLSQNELTGPLPEEMFASLSILTEVRLQNNGITGTLPDITLASSLSTLWLADNSLTGELPVDSIGLLTTLQFLDLADNSFDIPDEAQTTLETALPNCDISI